MVFKGVEKRSCHPFKVEGWPRHIKGQGQLMPEPLFVLVGRDEGFDHLGADDSLGRAL